MLKLPSEDKSFLVLETSSENLVICVDKRDNTGVAWSTMRKTEPISILLSIATNLMGVSAAGRFETLELNHERSAEGA